MNCVRALACLALAAWFTACSDEPEGAPGEPAVGAPHGRDVAGTLEPFASEAVYFLLTDRFVDGDPGNNQPQQGGAKWHTFDRPLTKDGVEIDNIGYLGGDFRGILDNADYIAEMGFTAVWITPIVENPDEAFAGGSPAGRHSLRRPGQGRLPRLLGRQLLRSRRAPGIAGTRFPGLRATDA